MRFFVVSAVFIHFVFLYSIFDIYFTSPLVHGMRPHAPASPAPATRLVLFVADGLRADRCFELNENGEPRTPYLRQIVTERGVWGVSHTRVPTESRPGHVALIGGFYEDVSAVSKGWKDNPVDFDSVFNQSTYTWSWGSPDILPMFSKGTAQDHIFMTMYPAESENFAGSNLHTLDTWVFDQVHSLFQSVNGYHDNTPTETSGDKRLRGRLGAESVVFFLHLLGIDTNGHAHNPGSKEYLDNIRVVDEGVHNITRLIEDYYQDGKTAFVFTSDHGMTDWGSHGAGLTDETQTPFIAWGAGIRYPLPSSENSTDNAEWGLSDILRRDIAQADVAPLMSALIGSNLPLNSVGMVHSDLLDLPGDHMAEILLTNARQIFAQFEIKMKSKQETTLSWFFRPFEELSVSSGLHYFREIESLAYDERYEESVLLSEELIRISLRGLRYYHSYDRFFLGCVMVLSFLGWMVYTTCCLLSHAGVSTVTTKLDEITTPFLLRQSSLSAIFRVLQIGCVSLLYVQHLPLTNYIYCLLPAFLWEAIFKRWRMFSSAADRLCSRGGLSLWSVILSAGLVAVGLEIIILSFFYRQLLSGGLVALAVWPWCQRSSGNIRNQKIAWSVSSCALAVFPLLPVVGRQAQHGLVLVAGVLTALSVLALMARNTGLRSRTLLVVQVVIGLLSSFVVNVNFWNIKAGETNSFLINVFSWTVLVAAWFVPLLSSTHLLTRLTSVLLSLISFYFLLSISYESLFILILCGFLYSWIFLEAAIVKCKVETTSFNSAESQHSLGLDDIRRAFIFLFVVLVSFFGTGNIASINSFEPASVYCFLTVFNPFVMGALILLKLALPFIIVTCSFYAIHVCTGVSMEGVFYLILLMCDFSGLHFFFLVRDEGSWLDIGTSISHYVISLVTTIFLLLLSRLSIFLTSVSLIKEDTKLE